VQDLALAGEGRQAGIRQVLAYQAEGRCLIANRGESATDADRITAQCNSCHSLAPIARKCIRNRCGRRSPVSWPCHPLLLDIVVCSDRNKVPVDLHGQKRSLRMAISVFLRFSWCEPRSRSGCFSLDSCDNHRCLTSWLFSW